MFFSINAVAFFGVSQLTGVLTERFELPVAWPFTRFPSFESGAAGLGINIEAVRYAPGRFSPVPEDAGLYAIVFEPETLAEARAELARRKIPHSPPLTFTGRYPADANTPVFHKRADQRGALWTLVFLGGMLGDQSSAERYSRGIERGDSRLAPLAGRLGGWLGSGRFAARFSAQRISERPFVFLCQYHGFNIPQGHATGLAALAARDGGPLGLVRTHELVVAARDPAAEADRWQQLLDPQAATFGRVVVRREGEEQVVLERHGLEGRWTRVTASLVQGGNIVAYETDTNRAKEDGDYVFIDSDPSDRPFRGWQKNKRDYEFARLLCRARYYPGTPRGVTRMWFNMYGATPGSVEGHQSRPDGLAKNPRSPYQAMFRSGSHQSATRGWLKPTWMTDSLVRKDLFGHSVNKGFLPDVHCPTGAPREAIVKITKAEPGGLNGKGLWRPAALGLRPKYERKAMKDYLSGKFVTATASPKKGGKG